MKNLYFLAEPQRPVERCSFDEDDLNPAIPETAEKGVPVNSVESSPASSESDNSETTNNSSDDDLDVPDEEIESVDDLLLGWWL